ncbi:putative MFS family arabinose efflux permease [Sphingomonas jejuensis]|uniref:MFS family arabinose efflux permease n=1 Tax=Sphingomonas jejuensis TaxID=904715 RepID=A0ABX0XQ01_9SPHN|nr:MFS transporter [Sphingomonas jejuensis]NJC34927.1 putative MFS family arabinose efflux permease [Sphingomonas jejuensis]
MATRGPGPVVPTPGYRRLVLGMLLLVYTFNFLDRQILGILAQPIKTELQLTDTQLGALGGIAFALLYSTLAIPLALVADRTSRSWVITISLTVWSGFTALCGIATGFWQLFLFRLGVGVGEAGGVAPSYAMIADYYPPEKRARALAIYSLGVPVGLAFGALLGGYIAQEFGWREAFVTVGLAGVVLAPIFRLVVREPGRGMMDAAPAAADRIRVSTVFPMLARKRSFWLMGFAAAFSSMCGYGLAFWVPSVLIRSFGFNLIETSMFVGSLLLIGGIAGVLAGGVLADRLGSRDRGWYARLPAIAWLLTAPLFAAGLYAPNATVAWLFLLLPHGLNILWLGPLITAVQHLVPPPMRATASACFLFINNLIGLGVGSWAMGAMSDGLAARYGDDSLLYATIIALSAYVVAALLGLLAVKPLRRDWVG